MNNHEPGLIPVAEDIWPPPPRGWEGAEGGVRVEQVEVWQERDRLTLRNRWARHVPVIFGFSLLLVALLPLSLSLVFSVSSTTHTLHAFWAYVAFLYLSLHHMLLYLSLFDCVGLVSLCWFIYDRRLHRGLFVLDKRGGAIRAGGGLFCLLSELDHVLIRVAVGRWQVYLMRVGGAESPTWGGIAGPRIPRNACLVADFRQQISAEDVAGIVAEFAGVPVKHQVRAKNSV